MKLTAYNPPSGPLKHVEEELPEAPHYPSANAEMRNGQRAWDRYEKELKSYTATLERLKRESIEYENPDLVKKQLWFNEGGYMSCCRERCKCLDGNNACVGSLKPDTFYTYDFDGTVEKIEVPEEDSGTDELGRKVDFHLVARLIPAKLEETQEMIFDDMFCKYFDLTYEQKKSGYHACLEIQKLFTIQRKPPFNQITF